VKWNEGVSESDNEKVEGKEEERAKPPARRGQRASE